MSRLPAFTRQISSKKKRSVSAKKSASVLFEETLSWYMRSSVMFSALFHKRSAFEYIAGPGKRQFKNGLLDTIEHSNPKRYPGQRIFIVDIDEYV
jgi:hypothetical protein